MEAIFPEVVREEEHVVEEFAQASGDAEEVAVAPTRVETYKAVNYLDLIPVLVQVIQEQQALLAGQQGEIEALKEALGKLGVTVE